MSFRKKSPFCPKKGSNLRRFYRYSLRVAGCNAENDHRLLPQRKGERASVSRVLYLPRRRWRPFIWDRSLQRPQAAYPPASVGPTSSAGLFGLAPDGVYRAGRVTPPAGGLLPHRFTLAADDCSSGRRFAFCCTFRGIAPPGRYPASCPTEPGLSSPPQK
jgi:hypothetical protein